MSDYRNFDQLQTNILSVLRHGFFRPWFELTDGQFLYGKLTYLSSFKKVCVIETAQGEWIIKRKGFMSRTLFIQQPEDVNIGTLIPETWNRNVGLNMNDGFEAMYTNKTIFSRTNTLISNQYGDILDIKAALWSWKKPFIVTIDLNLQKDIPALPLLTMLGVSLILWKQSQAAAAH